MGARKARKSTNAKSTKAAGRRATSKNKAKAAKPPGKPATGTRAARAEKSAPRKAQKRAKPLARSTAASKRQVSKKTGASAKAKGKAQKRTQVAKPQKASTSGKQKVTTKKAQRTTRTRRAETARKTTAASRSEKPRSTRAPRTEKGSRAKPVTRAVRGKATRAERRPVKSAAKDAKRTAAKKSASKAMAARPAKRSAAKPAATKRSATKRSATKRSAIKPGAEKTKKSAKATADTSAKAPVEKAGTNGKQDGEVSVGAGVVVRRRKPTNGAAAALGGLSSSNGKSEAPLSETNEAVANAPESPRALIGVRRGRLPRRENRADGDDQRTDEPPLPVTPTLPRELLSDASWNKFEPVAQRFGLTLDGTVRRAVQASMEGKDALVMLRPGSPLRLAHAVAAVLLPQPVLVVGPVLEQLRDQHDWLSQRGVRSVVLEGGYRGEAERRVLEPITEGRVDIVHVTPSGLTQGTLQALARSGIGLVVVQNGAQCSSKSHEYNPVLARIPEQLRRLSSPPTWVTVPPSPSAVRRDVSSIFALRVTENLFQHAVPKNLRLSVMRVGGEKRKRTMVEAVNSLQAPGVVFCATPLQAEAAYAALKTSGVSVKRYHERMSSAERATEALHFGMPGSQAFLVATSAFAALNPEHFLQAANKDAVPLTFGERTSKTDIRSIVHFQAPQSLEQYAQEIALAGRDKRTAECVMLYDESDCALHETERREIALQSAQLERLKGPLQEVANTEKPTTVEMLAQQSRLPPPRVEQWISLLERSGTLSQRGGWVHCAVRPQTLPGRLRQLQNGIADMNELEPQRLDAVVRYVRDPGCRVQALERYFEVGVSDPCERCDACDPSYSVLQAASAAPALLQRGSMF